MPGPVPTSPANNDYKPGFAAALMLKDLRLAQEAALRSGAATPLGAQAAQLYGLFESAGMAGRISPRSFTSCVASFRKRGTEMTYETILVETIGRVALITLNRPKALNALNSQLMKELIAAVSAMDTDNGIGCIVLTGSERAFAAGADIKEMQPKTYAEMYAGDCSPTWERFARVRKPIIAAVAGYALGGGCELAMMCDFIIAADTAKFGQPEITLGIMPGHRRQPAPDPLRRQVQGHGDVPDRPDDGRRRGRALRPGLPRGAGRPSWWTEAMKAAETIAAMSLPGVMMTKETVNRAYETTLAEGLRFERRLFHAMFATGRPEGGHGGFRGKA